MLSRRLPEGGRIDRSRALSFSVDGKGYFGYEGDTLASALLGAGRSIVGRSFKYHRPRGFLGAGMDEPNGLFTVDRGERTEPNVLATQVALCDGIAARTQNAWPTVEFDLRAVNGWIAPLLKAGFYYKTFMGPMRGSWMLYEPLIRNAAGLGSASYERDVDRYETRYAFTDVLVIGAGPAGLSAALSAARAGARVILVEQDALLGGSLLCAAPTDAAERWRKQVEDELRALPGVEILIQTTAIGIYDTHTQVLVTRRGTLRADPKRGEALETVTIVRSKTVVHAVGAIERPLVFANNDRPGVMLAGAVRTYLNRYAVLCGQRVVVVSNNDGAYETAFDLAPYVENIVLADVRRAVDPALTGRAQELGVEVRTSTAVTDVRGRRGVRGAVLRPVASAGGSQVLACDLVCMSGGWSPLVHLTSHGGIKPRYDEISAAFVPGGFALGHFGAGAVNGHFALPMAVEEGWHAGIRAAAHAGFERATGSPPSGLQAGQTEHVANLRIEPSWTLSGKRDARAFVDFQNDVTACDIALAHEEGYISVEHLKRYTTLGMGTDQGKTSNVNAIAIMADLRDVGLTQAGTTTFRPPFMPVRIGALAGRHVGKHFRPVRRSPLHRWHLQHGAQMIEAGAWVRPWYYRWAGDGVATAYIEEMRLVRRAVGISDVSTLGKIDVQGPDAAEFLDRVYVNDFAKLAVGRARYGVMLNDAGMIFDDGTTTRLGRTRYFMTTTTAGAAEVMSRLEFLAQACWPELRVHLNSVTDEWAGIAIAGPRSRLALERSFPDAPLSDQVLPHMGAVEFDWDGVPVRIIRLSFSGELAYELYVPAGFGTAFWEHILAQGESLDMRPYGLESLASLRIEKGHIAGSEVDPRYTLGDVGLGRMARPDKAYVGQELAARPLLNSPDRPTLVGLECLDARVPLRGGAILFAATDDIRGHGRGYITSVTWSDALGRFIALGFYAGGLDHIGEEVICAFPLKGEQVRARISSPVFLDPKGSRLRV